MGKVKSDQISPADGYISFVESSSDPGALANKGSIYTKDDAGDTELFYIDDSGNIVQITKDGSLNADEIAAHTVGGSEHVADTLANFNTKISDATLIDESELDNYAALDHDATHVSGGSDEIDGDILDIDWNPSNYTPTTSPSEVTSADELTAHLAGIDGYLLVLGNDIYDNATGLSAHEADTANPHGTDIGNLGTGTLSELNAAVTDATLIDESELDAYAAVDHDATHVSGGSDEIDGDILDIDWNPSNYTPTTSPSEVTSADELTAHLAGIDGYLLVLGNDIYDNAANLSAHEADTANPHGTDVGNLGTGTLSELNAAVTDATLIDESELDAYAAVDHDATHVSGGSDEIDGDILDIDWNPSNYTPTTDPSEVTSVDELTAHLAGIDGYLLVLGNDVYDNATNLSAHEADMANPHSTDVGNLGSGTLSELNTAITDATLIDESELDAYAAVDHDATHVSGGSDEIDGDVLDIDWNPSNYTPTTSPSEVTSADELTAHLAGIDGYLLSVGNTAEFHKTDVMNPHEVSLDYAYDASGSGAGRTIAADSGPVFINAGGNSGLEIDGYITLNETSDPTALSDAGMLYTKDDSGDTELFYMDDSGNATQITEDGELNETHVYGEMYISSSAATTTSQTPTYAKVAGTYADGYLSGFTHSSGTLTYTGTKTKYFEVNVQISATASSADVYYFRMAVDGTTVVKSEGRRRISSVANEIGSISLCCILELTQNDEVEVYVTREGSSGNVTAEKMVVTLHSI